MKLTLQESKLISIFAFTFEFYGVSTSSVSVKPNCHLLHYCVLIAWGSCILRAMITFHVSTAAPLEGTAGGSFSLSPLTPLVFSWTLLTLS